MLRQGAPAEEFFLIERGRASVKRDDRHVAELGAGDFFGGLALLQGGRGRLWLGEHGVAETVAAATGVDPATARERIVAGMGGIASGRFTTPAEVATLVALLASPRTASVTGANYLIDGGLIKTT